jgi:hypothetical protein
VPDETQYPGGLESEDEHVSEHASCLCSSKQHLRGSTGARVDRAVFA